ncbi:hypothetical protein [uncultured Roseobacter sp.]|uniref:hypothetical protein n=1 Tax=uncultured Roseobacter sp. TaxID=114847 RepID=UPI00261B871C|nr:hypothetical protein [uncultured Roseobacter sp.]
MAITLRGGTGILFPQNPGEPMALPADMVRAVGNNGFRPTVLKHSKIRLLCFYATSHFRGRVQTKCPMEPVRASDIAEVGLKLTCIDEFQAKPFTAKFFIGFRENRGFST